MSPFANEKALRRRIPLEYKLAGLRLTNPTGKQSGVVLIEHRSNQGIFISGEFLDSVDEVLSWIRDRQVQEKGRLSRKELGDEIVSKAPDKDLQSKGST